MKLALIIGSSGQVARALRDLFLSRGVPFLCTSSKGGDYPLDLADAESIRHCFSEVEKKWGLNDVEVFLVGALTHVDRCEQEKDFCKSMNTYGPLLVAKECERLHYSLTFFSSEYVFGEAEYRGGAVGPFSEEDSPNPTSWYGRCKLNAELEIQKICPALFIRTTMVFSWDPSGMNFFMQLYRHLNAWKAGAPLFRIPVDQISTPTYAPSLALGTWLLREKKKEGIYHITGSDLLSRKDFLERMMHFFHFSEVKKEGFQFLLTKDLIQIARRPLTAGLKCEKAKREGVKISSLQEAFVQIKEKRAVSQEC